MMQRKILFIGVQPEEVRSIFAESFGSSTAILVRPCMEDALPELSNNGDISLVLTKPDHLDHAKKPLAAKRNAVVPPRVQVNELPDIVGQSDKTLEVQRRICQVAPTESNVLIEGECGTGKELVARAIHYHSLRRHKPFIKVNCAALPETLIESELFGHVRGAFTGAVRNRRGRFNQAHGGTILLDEIGSIPLSSQAKLLRVLQEKEFEPVGSSRTAKTDVRIIATDNSDLTKAVQERKFREDLYYRLSVFAIVVPPLRERKNDIPLLAGHVLTKYASLNPRVRRISREALELMVNHHWPGNVRQLENAIQHALIVEKMDTIRPASLPVRFNTPPSLTVTDCQSLRMRDKLNLYEKQLIQDAITQSRGKKKRAAQMLGVHPKNFSYLLNKHGL